MNDICLRIMLILLIGLLAAVVLLSLAQLFNVVYTGKRKLPKRLSWAIDIIVIGIYPQFYLASFDYGSSMTCCTDNFTFSPDHRLTIYFWIAISILCYFVSRVRREIKPPLQELLINSVLAFALILAGLIAYQMQSAMWLIGCLPIICLFLTELLINQKRVQNSCDMKEFNKENWMVSSARKVLSWNLFISFPILLLLFLPIHLLATAILLLFGQRPDSIVRAFTDTYYLGFSQLNHECLNVECGGHYLCSVAANGHESIVKPERLGLRNNQLIKCNRQLLVSNAFEELLQQRFPSFHKSIRKSYDKLGDHIHTNHKSYENKLISDIVYLLMKPAEWFFVLVLYLFDSSPETRIAQQYLAWEERDVIRELLSDRKGK